MERPLRPVMHLFLQNLIFTSRIRMLTRKIEIYIKCNHCKELGESVAARRRRLGLKQAEVAAMAGVTAESLSRFERGRSAEFGSRKLLAVLAVLGAELEVIAKGEAGNLDQLRRERAQAPGADGKSGRQ